MRYLTSSNEAKTATLQGKLAEGWEVEHVGTVGNGGTQSSVYLLRRLQFHLQRVAVP